MVRNAVNEQSLCDELWLQITKGGRRPPSKHETQNVMHMAKYIIRFTYIIQQPHDTRHCIPSKSIRTVLIDNQASS